MDDEDLGKTKEFSPLGFTAAPVSRYGGHRQRTSKTEPVSRKTRKKCTEEHENHERWLVSYADFITLLLAFFVVMYAISSVNEGKYRVLSDSMVAAFRAPPSDIVPVQIGQPMRSLVVSKVEIPKSPAIRPDLAATQNMSDQVESDPTEQRALDRISQEIQNSFSDLVNKDLVTLRRDKLWLEVDIKTSILFPSGSAALEQKALPILTNLAEILKKFPNPIQVEGFTDDKPINSVIFPSNWELSAGRAASVVHLFNKLGVKPERMAAVGYGEYRPTADNSTPEGRNKNRRVVLQILAHSDARKVLGIVK